jgi:glycosyltransferase involved in cell wall biosynthesis
MIEPQVTVIVPVRDGERYLVDALESVLRQTTPPAEVLVIDDGSRDASPDIATRFGPPVRVVRQGTDGLAAALNRGIAEASGGVIAFCDADDISTPDRLERQLDALARDPECAIVGGLVQQFVSPDAVEATRGLRIDMRPTSVALNGLLMVRAEVFELVGGFDTSMETVVGIDWMSRARSFGLRMTMIDEVVLLRRVHGGNLGVVSHVQKRHDLVRALRAHRHRVHGTDDEPVG